MFSYVSMGLNVGLSLALCWFVIENGNLQRASSERELTQAKVIAGQMQAAQAHIQKVSTEYEEKQEKSKREINNLRRNVAAGTGRLRVNATCPGVPADTATTSGTDATSSGFDAAFVEDYFLLRERAETATRQIEGLQAYIRGLRPTENITQ